MKPHGTCLTNSDLLAVHAAVGHPAFGICMDPGNILCAPPLPRFYSLWRRLCPPDFDDCGCADYTKGEALPTDGLDSLAPCVSAVVMKDCVLNPDSPQVTTEPPPRGRCWLTEDSCRLEWREPCTLMPLAPRARPKA